MYENAITKGWRESLALKFKHEDLSSPTTTKHKTSWVGQRALGISLHWRDRIADDLEFVIFLPPPPRLQDVPQSLVYVGLEIDTPPQPLASHQRPDKHSPDIHSPQLAFIQCLSHLASLLWGQIVWQELQSLAHAVEVSMNGGQTPSSQGTQVPAGGLGVVVWEKLIRADLLPINHGISLI